MRAVRNKLVKTIPPWNKKWLGYYHRPFDYRGTFLKTLYEGCASVEHVDSDSKLNG